MFKEVVAKVQSGIKLTREEALFLLDIEILSKEYYEIIELANHYSREAFNNKGIIFSQVGMDAQKCDVNCKFCSLAKDSYDNDEKNIKSIEDILAEVSYLVEQGSNEIFLMTTANFNNNLFLEYVKEVKKIIPKEMKLVANIGDFDIEFAKKLKYSGITGVYHICRLREGIDTDVTVDTRIKTLDAIKESGLELYYCVEPIGPEHTNEELIEEIFRTIQYPVEVMAVMKRVAVENTLKYNDGEISNSKLALIAAVTTLSVRPKRAMGVHEPIEICLISGCNQIYAEVGCNPRDIELETKNSRGFSIDKAKKLLFNTNW